MLSQLHIENIALIKCMDVDFYRGFSTVTGETGAGKSIIIDSINLLLGAKADKELIRQGENTATVSGFFTDISDQTRKVLGEWGIEPDEEGSILLQRTVSAESKSTTRINGRSIPLAMYKSVGMSLVNIHGQHDSADLQRPETHILYLDKFAKDFEESEAYGKVYRALCDVRSELYGLQKDERDFARREEMLRYQINDIESAGISVGEEEKILSEKKILKNAKDLIRKITTVYRALYKNPKGASAGQLMDVAAKTLEDMSEVYPEAHTLSEKVYDLSAEACSVAETIASLMPDMSGDSEARISEIDDRLDMIRRMKRKYGATEEEILSYYQKAQEELSAIEHSGERIAELAGQEKAMYAEASRLAGLLRSRPLEASLKLSESVCGTLKYLDMDKVTFLAKVEEKKKDGNLDLDANGCDRVEFYIAANLGEGMKPLSAVASGGELSRIMLAIKCAYADSDFISTLIFDEIDTGVSGKTSYKIGKMLKKLSAGTQVLCVTHSAQIGAIADNQFLVGKHSSDERTFTCMKLLSPDERVEEISRIIGGESITERVRDTAREMLAEAGNL